MFYKGNEDREKQLRFSIRKVSFGAASVAVAALYLFMGSGAVSAAEAQAVQSNEEVAADKDSEIEKKSEEQQPTYAAPAAKEQGSATNTEAGDEGKQESHPETKEEEANSSERSETTTKTQSDENSVSGDSSSPKSEGEGTRSEEASNKPKVRKRRDADPAPPATAADADSDANQVFEGASDDDSVEELARKLRALDDTVENNKKVSEELDSLGAATGVEKGDVQNINEFGGWTAITDSEGNGKFAIARKTDNGVFPLETINTVRNFKTGKSYTYLREQAIDRDADYMLFLSEVRTKASENEQTFNGKAYQNSGLGPTLSYGLKGYNGIQKTFKAYSPDSGSKVKITFKTGYSGDIDGTKAKYRVQVFTSESSTKPVYDVAFDPQNNTSNKDMIVLKASDGSRVTREFIEKPWTGTLDKQGLENQMAQAGYTPNGMAGRFTSREIELPAGVTDYTVKISSADNDHLGMGYQSSHRHYALPISGRDFHVTQNIGGVAKSLLQKIYTKLKESEEKDKNFKTPESQRRYEEALVEANQLLQQDTKSTTEYQTILQTLLEKRQELANSSQEASIKSNATDEIDKAAAAKIQAIEGNAKLSEADKAKAKEAVRTAAEAAKSEIEQAADQTAVDEKEAAGKKAISDVAEVGKEQAKSEIDKAAAAKIQAIEGNAKREASAQANAPKASKELPNTGTADSTVAMVAAAASALLGLGLAGRRRKEDEEA
ncbi:YSIRK-type signal peptide-containing protein [Streptococcus sp. 4155]|uniref:YSIRK-type signal peptide-containing protein n=2 Tax=unclassified Streptococcus TaxID=2608887 RepID=UPI001561D793|nr:YSIRK-type signal peptide-containing protein [Streptococcus sp. 4155]